MIIIIIIIIIVAWKLASSSRPRVIASDSQFF